MNDSSIVVVILVNPSAGVHTDSSKTESSKQRNTDSSKKKYRLVENKYNVKGGVRVKVHGGPKIIIFSRGGGRGAE